MSTTDPTGAEALAEAQATARDAPDVTLTVSAATPLRLTVVPLDYGMAPFVALRLGPWLVVAVHQVDAAARLAALATEAAQELQRSASPQPQDNAAGEEP